MSGETRIEVLPGDITGQAVEAIVNTANSSDAVRQALRSLRVVETTVGVARLVLFDPSRAPQAKVILAEL